MGINSQEQLDAFETVADWMFEHLLADFPKGIDRDWLAEELTNRFGQCSSELCNALEREAIVWRRKK